MTDLSSDERRTPGPRAGELDLLRIYLDDLGWHRLLGRQDEVRLAQAIEQGAEAEAALGGSTRLSAGRRRQLRRVVALGQAAREEFTAANLRLVVSIAKGYQHRGVDLADLIQEGNIGVMRAIERFDWRKGYKFSTYATWWIRKAVIQAVSDGGSSVRLPRHRREQARELADASERLERRLGHPPGDGELAHETGIRTADVVAIRRAAARVVSLSSPIDDDGSELSDVVADPRADTDAQATSSLLPAEVEHLLSSLSPSASRVMHLRYGLGDGRARTAAEVASVMHISPERVRQIESRALAALRHRVPPEFRAS